MASVEAYNTLKTYLVNTHAPIRTIDYDTIDKALEQGRDQFLCLHEIETYETQIAMADSATLCLRETSGFIVHVLVPAPEASDAARQLGEQVYTDIRYRNIGKLRVVDVNPPEMEIMNEYSRIDMR